MISMARAPYEAVGSPAPYVDFNSIVRVGDVIMRLDPSLFETQLEQARANLLRSEAEVEQ